MATLPTPKTWSAGLWSAADMNKEMRDTLVFYLHPPLCIVRKDNDAQQVGNGSGIGFAGRSSITWDTVVHDSDECFNSSDSTKLMANTPGYYHLTLQVQWVMPDVAINTHRGQYIDRYSSSGTKIETASIYRNNAQTTDETYTGSMVMQMNVGDYVVAIADLFYMNNDVLAEHDPSAGRYGCQFEMRWVSAL